MGRPFIWTPDQTGPNSTIREHFLHNRAGRNPGCNPLGIDTIRTLADGKENACQDADVHDVFCSADN